jgi:hypothetical protein
LKARRLKPKKIFFGGAGGKLYYIDDIDFTDYNR